MVKKLGKKIVADLKKRSEKSLDLAKQILQKERIEDSTLSNALKHYIKNWNDFTHPGFFSLACEAVGGNPDDAVSAQAAIAMMAAAFDIHDDIIDKSKVKHKIPTVYGKFGTEVALLLGDALLINGFKLFIESAKALPREKEALETLKRLTFEVGNAHALEISLKKRKSVSTDDFMKIIEMKAAAIELDMYAGALFGRAKDAEIELLANLGRIIGILVMLREEFIDIFELEELRQRISVHDFPAPLLFAIQDSEVQGEVAKIISKSNITQNDVDKLVPLTLEAISVVKLKENMQGLITEGLQLAKNLSNVTTQSKLQAILDFMLEDL
ncbi:MAG: polyprenyl synthetase family protein [Candidatus Bathyarchaeia archaeon]